MHTPFSSFIFQVGSCVPPKRGSAPNAQPRDAGWQPERHSRTSDLIGPSILFNYVLAFPNSLTLRFAIRHRAAAAAGSALAGSSLPAISIRIDAIRTCPRALRCQQAGFLCQPFPADRNANGGRDKSRNKRNLIPKAAADSGAVC